MALAQWLVKDRGSEEDLTPSRVLKVPDIPVRPGAGRVQTRVEYLINPAHEREFRALMEESKRSRLSQGALDWQLLHSLDQPGRYVEQIIDPSWTEHLRRFDRITAADARLRERRLAFHIGEGPPQVTRYLIEQD